MLSGKKISLMQRSVMQNAISAPQVGGIVRLTRFILGGTFLIEMTGAVAMMPSFCGRYGMRGIWMAVFHSISAFCNAGFDILGTKTHQFASLTGYSRNGVINITIMLLIIIGGIGFLTWEDIYLNHLQWKRYRLQSKLIRQCSFILKISVGLQVCMVCGMHCSSLLQREQQDIIRQTWQQCREHPRLS